MKNVTFDRLITWIKHSYKFNSYNTLRFFGSYANVSCGPLLLSICQRPPPIVLYAEICARSPTKLRIVLGQARKFPRDTYILFSQFIVSLNAHWKLCGNLYSMRMLLIFLCYGKVIITFQNNHTTESVSDLSLGEGILRGEELLRQGWSSVGPSYAGIWVIL